jgi:uncharacterized protein YbjT (DUF2867 family)
MAVEGTILVIGATGAQGGGVARHLLAGGRFAVRALTRHPDSGRATALRQAGAEVVQGDLDSPASLRAALDGCVGVFGVTNFWEHFGREYEQGRQLIDAVAASGVEQFVFSTLPHAKKISGGELDVPHFDIKAQLEQYARERKPGAIFIHVAFYFENFLGFIPLQRQEDGAFAFGFPQGETPLAGVGVEDVGGVVAPLFERAHEFQGQTIGIVGDDLTGDQYAETMTRVLGTRIVYNHIPREVFAAFGFPGADDLANMFDFNRRFIPDRRADLEQSRRLYPAMQTFETWAHANEDRLRQGLTG